MTRSGNWRSHMPTLSTVEISTYWLRCTARTRVLGNTVWAPAALKPFLPTHSSQIGIAVLLVANHLIEFDPMSTDGASSDSGAPTARGTVWAHGYIDDGDEGFIQQLIKYEDRYVRVDGVWKFTPSTSPAVAWLATR